MNKKIKIWFNYLVTSIIIMLFLSFEPIIDKKYKLLIGCILALISYLIYLNIKKDYNKNEEKNKIINIYELTYEDAIKRADKYFSLYIRHKYPVCVICKKEATDCGHFIRREILATRWLEENAFSLCRECNMKHETNPEPYTNFYKSYYDEEFIEALNSFKYDNSIKLHTKDIIDIGTYYKEKLYSGDKYCLPPECLVKIKKKLYEKSS